MILKKIEELKGNEILGRPIMTLDYQVILSEGVILKKEYIEKLYELGIFEVYIEEPKSATSEIAILKSDIENNVKEKVKDVLERHTYQNNKELSQLSKTTDNIISNILEEEQVVEKIFDIKERNTDIYEHSISVCSTSILTALKLKIEIEKVHDIGVSCLLHDIGLRYTTINFSERDMSEMSSKELGEYKKHPVYGYSSLKNEAWISELSKSIILNHHETMDGGGYPLKLKDIPFESKIVTVCDTFDEMICGIAQKKVKVYEALEYLKRYKNIKFDGTIVDAFLSFTAVYPAGTHVVTNEGETAIVIAQNKEFKDRPVIRILREKNGNYVTEDRNIDLVKASNIFIDKVLD